MLVKDSIDHVRETNLQHIIAFKVQTGEVPVVIGTIYLPPRLVHVPIVEMTSFLNCNDTAYLIGDLNANSRNLGNTSNNPLGEWLYNMNIEHTW